MSHPKKYSKSPSVVHSIRAICEKTPKSKSGLRSRRQKVRLQLRLPQFSKVRLQLRLPQFSKCRLRLRLRLLKIPEVRLQLRLPTSIFPKYPYKKRILESESVHKIQLRLRLLKISKTDSRLRLPPKVTRISTPTPP